MPSGLARKRNIPQVDNRRHLLVNLRCPEEAINVIFGDQFRSRRLP
jgi:hypothetical protein